MVTTSSVADLQLCRLAPVRLTNFDQTDTESEPCEVEVLINPYLKAHPCILGLNSIVKLRVQVDFSAQTIRAMGSPIIYTLRPQVESFLPKAGPADQTVPVESGSRARPSMHTPPPKGKPRNRESNSSAPED